MLQVLALFLANAAGWGHWSSCSGAESTDSCANHGAAAAASAPTPAAASCAAASLCVHL